MNKDVIISLVSKAFSDTQLADGIGLWQAQAIDDYQSDEIQQEKRVLDEKLAWQAIPPEDLQRCYSSLSFFDADGMRFHLPAFILAELEGKVDAGIIFHLTQLDDFGLSKFSTLDSEQRTAVLEFLEWCLGEDEYEFDHPAIIRAIDAYWRNKHHSNATSL